MKTKLTIAAVLLIMAPITAFAEGCGGSHSDQQASMSCADGMTFDAESNNCVAETTS